MGKYWQFLKMSFMELFEYRMNLVWEIAGSALSISIIYAFWIAVLGSGFANKEYSFTSIGLYYLMIILVDYITHFGFEDISNSIYNGYIEVEINRPYNFLLKTLLLSAGRRLTKSIVMILFVMIVVKLNHYEIESRNIILFILTVFLASVMRFYIGVSVGTLAFWFRRVHGFHSLFWNIGDLFSGRLIPVDILPQAIFVIGKWLPFQYLFYFPIQILLHPSTVENVGVSILIQITWIGVFWLGYKLLWRQGLRNIEAVGG